MNMAPRDLNALLGSRICHDLINPLGAIGNGLELLAMSGVAASPEMALIGESVENANARIRFFRVAFGGASPGQEIGRAEILSILGPLSSGRLGIDWQIAVHPLRAETKLAFLLIQCLETALPWGGKIAVTRDADTWHLIAKADRIRPLPELWTLATDADSDSDVTAADVHFPLAARAATTLGRKVTTDIKETCITLSF